MAEDIVPRSERPIFAPRPTAARRVLRIAGYLALAVALYAAFGFLVLPALVKWQAPRHLGDLLAREVTLGDVAFNPFTFEARIDGLVIRDGANARPLASFESLYVNASARSILERGAVIDAIRLVRPQASLIRLDAGRYNFSDIVERLGGTPAPSSDDASSPRFALANIEVVDGEIEFDDRPEHANHAVRGITAGVPFLSNFPIHIETKVEPRFAAAVNGDPIEITGESRPFKDTYETLARIALRDVDLPRYLEYVPATLDFRVPSAKLDATLVLRFSQPRRGATELSLEGDARLAQVSVTDKTGAPLVALETLEVAIEKFDLAANRLDLAKVALVAPAVEVRRDPGGRLNLEHLAPRMTVAPTPASSPPARPFAVAVREFTMRGGAVGFEDETNPRPFRARLHDIEATVNDLSLAEGAAARYTLAFQSDLKAAGRSSGRFAVNPIAADGRIEIEGLRLADFAAWYERFIAVDIPEGTLTVAGDYRLALRDGYPEIHLAGAQVDLQALRVSQRAERQDLLRATSLGVSGVDLDLGRSSITIAEVRADGLQLRLHRLPDGSINLARLLATDPAGAPSPTAAQATAPAWAYVVKRVALERAGVRFVDAAVRPTLDLPIEAVQLTLENLSSERGARARLQVRAQVDRTATLAADGHVVLDPPAAELAIEATGVPIPRFEPYYGSRLNVAIGAGTAGTRGRLVASLPPGASPAVKYSGDATVSNLAVQDRAGGDDLLRWRSLFLGQLAIDTTPLALTLGEVALTDFFARIVVAANGRLNLQDLARADDTAATTGAPASPPTDPSAAAAPDLRIGRVTFQEGNVAFSDFFVKPNYSANLTQITGAVTAITPERAGDVDIRGRINNTGSLEVAGQVNPLSRNLFLDLKAAARDIDLPAMTPYSAKYVGYGIEKGKLALDVAYRLEDNQLAAQNRLTLDQLTFGEKVDVPGAPDLPVQLAVALLKDRNGVIDIDLPISGSLDDPQFSIGGIIGRVLVNLIVKAVTSPFALIASAFGGGGSGELGHLEFAAGTAAVDAASENKLGVLARALAERPGLRLDIGGRVEPDVDREALRRARLDERVRAEKVRATAAQQPTTSSSVITIDPAEYPKWLTALYRGATFERPRNVIGMLREQPVPEMERMLLEHTTVTDDDLRELANRRAQAAKDHLVDKGGVSPARIFVIAPRSGADDLREKGDQGRASRADFTLR